MQVLAVREWWTTEPPEVVKVKKHALEQFVARSGRKSENGVEGKLLKWFHKGDPVRRVGPAHVKALAHYGETRYRRYGGWIVVAEYDSIVTVYKADKGKWEPTEPTAPTLRPFHI